MAERLQNTPQGTADGGWYMSPSEMLLQMLGRAVHNWYQAHGVPIPAEVRKNLLQEGVLLQVAEAGRPKHYLFRPDGTAHEVIVNPQNPQLYQMGPPIPYEEFRRRYERDLPGFFRVVQQAQQAQQAPQAQPNQAQRMFGMDPQMLMMLLLMMALMGRSGGGGGYGVPMQMTTVGYT